MSLRGGTNQRGRGGAGRGGGPPRGGTGGGRGGRGGYAPAASSNAPVQAFNAMSIRDRVAVDGSALQMDQQVSAPKSDPMPGNKVDPNVGQNILKAIAPLASDAEFPLRKTLATPNTTVFTNHFEIKLDPKMQLYEYNIQGLPARVGKRTCRILVREMINAIPFLRANQDMFATDYEKKLISWIEIAPDNLGPVEVKSSERRSLVGIGLELVGMLNTSLLQEYADGKVAPTKEVELELKWVEKALNMVISTVLSRGSFSLKANKFFVTGGHESLGPSLCAIRGYFYSVKPGMGQILLNLSSCTSAFYQPILVSEFLSDEFTFRSRDERLTQLRGLRVQLTYEPASKAKRSHSATIEARIKSIAGTGVAVGLQKFTLDGRDGKPDSEITVQQHFKDTYRIEALNPNMPAINCGTDEFPMWYLPETLQILPYQIYKRRVPDALTADMLEIANHHPEETRALLEHEGLRMLGLIPGVGLSTFPACSAIQIDSRMLQIPATILPYPKPEYSNGSVAMTKPSWDLTRHKFLLTNNRVVFKCFMIIVPDGIGEIADPAFLQHTWDAFVAGSKTYSTGTFSRVGHHMSPDLARNRAEATIAMDKAQAKGANYIMLFLGKKSIPAYSAIKDLADRKYGMHSSCLVYKDRGFTLQYWGNLMMKVNLKTGGLNHTAAGVNDVLKDTLVLGADVTHPGPGSLFGTPSIAAIVGSVDQYGGKFLGSMRLQPRDTACEDIQDVESMVVERIKEWFENNKRQLPRNILYYRDGVSDTQYSQVKDNELPQIRKAFATVVKMFKLTTTVKPKLTAIVVAKRHHVRFMPHPFDAMPKNGNCKPGTLVEQAVTSPVFRDFYLQSHNGLQGTARSAHYFTLVNETGMTEQQIQAFTHKLCYTYVRATMGVSYAPPAYYADRLCERGRCYLRDFLAPGPNSPLANGYKQEKGKWLKVAKDARETKYRPMRTTKMYDGKLREFKSEEELQQEDEDKKDVEKRMKSETFERAKVVFYGGTVVRNPWNPKIGNTMFWM